MRRLVFGMAAVLGALAAVGAGCEAIVGSSLPPYSCAGTSPSACPAGSYCSNGACVPCSGVACGAGDASFDAAVGDGPTESALNTGPDAADARAEGGAVEAGPDGAVGDAPSVDGEADAMPDAVVDAACDGGVGCACSSATSCTSGICGLADVLGTALVTAHGATCVTSCCTSSDCVAGDVCYAPGNAGTYCVPSTWVGAPATLGTATGGATCHANTDCRSGSCQGGRLRV